MRFLLVLLLLCAVVSGLLDPQFKLWQDSQLHEIMGVSADTIKKKLQIPTFNRDINDYEGTEYIERDQLEPVVLNHINMLEEQALVDNDVDVESLVELANIYMYGNFSLKPNYLAAKDLYIKALSTETKKDQKQEELIRKARGEASFMLGFIFSTGLFGEIPVDEELATLYYQFGVESGNFNAIYAMAYRYHNGIGVPENCELALYYYTQISHAGIKLLTDELNQYGTIDEDLSYDIRLPDFNGGLYGNYVSESKSTVVNNEERFNQNIELLNRNGNNANNEYIECYKEALIYYYGDYFHPRNYSKAFETLLGCIDISDLSRQTKSFRNLDSVEQPIVSYSLSLLGHMFLRGYGVEQDYAMAYKVIKISLKVMDNPMALTDLGWMHEHSILEQTSNVTAAYDYYWLAKTAESRMALAKMMLNSTPDKMYFQVQDKKTFYEYVKTAAFNHYTEAVFMFGEFLLNSFASEVEPDVDVTCESTIIYYKHCAELLEKFYFPHLKFAFEEFNNKRYKNSLLGYAMAAEQGITNAQVLAAFLLHQPKPLLGNNILFVKERVESAVRYYQYAAASLDIDASITLGDMYWNGVDGSFAKNYNYAFNYYQKGALQHSSHSYYNLALMYEYGLGPVNESDYNMAKRYYDMSLKHRTSNRFPVNVALMRLRIKYMFSKQKQPPSDHTGWFSAFTRLGENKEKSLPKDAEISRAEAFHTGSSLSEEENDFGDYLVMFVVFMIFATAFFQEMIARWRRMRGGNGNNNDNNNGNNRADQNQNRDNDNDNDNDNATNDNENNNNDNDEGGNVDGNNDGGRRGFWRGNFRDGINIEVNFAI